MYKTIIRPLLFLVDPEKIHRITSRLLILLLRIPFLPSLLRRLYTVQDPRLERKLWGLTFKNPVGLAAGFDKNADLYPALATLGFGFIEIGTVTPRPQAGNPTKRLFRLEADKGLINRMGFNNDGLEKVVEALKNHKSPLIIGGNIGKNTDTAPEDYTRDYLECFYALHPYVDYFVLNVSCPNVGSHQKLTDKAYLRTLITDVQQANSSFATQKPILLKIAPDLNRIQLDEIIELVQETRLEGVIATNTSVSRDGLNTTKETLDSIGNGGLSGAPVRERSTEVIRYLAATSNKSFTIIGVGGVDSAEAALEKLEAGADLVQVYTGFVYEGPSLIKQINKSLLKVQ
ncbi:MAG: quinone-dependent dihydroorotate dehydrogenase [Lutibacter sp.]|nr:quinone-dependent dihydroorotate dehydrogenase [Lutibacter sp.]